MGADGIIVDPPAFRQNLRFLQRIEQLPVEKHAKAFLLYG
jgi:hypothetical protein